MYEQISAGRKNDSTSAITSFVRSGLSDTALKQMLREYAGPYRELMAFYRCAMMEVETKFKVLSEELSLQNDHNPIESIKTRLKKPESILEKAAARNISLKAENLEEGIHDIAGVRVICSFVSDIYMLANALLKQDDIVLVAEKDYIKKPKPNGYRSLHLIIEIPIFLHDRKRIVKVEVQLRTIAMDWWASSEHKIRYKKNLPEGVLQEIDRELLECARIGANLDAKMENIQEKALSHCAKTKMNNETAPHSPQHTSS
jgi:putative GTP pyrophosphokinase